MTDESNSKVRGHYRAVELKCSATSLNGNTDGLVCNCLLQTLLTVHWYIFIAVDRNNLCIFLRLTQHIKATVRKKILVHGNLRDNYGGETYPVDITPVVSALVRVVLLGVDSTVLDDELKRIVHQTSIAPLVV